MFEKIFLTATLAEAKPLIERYDLDFFEKKPFAIFKNDKTALIISKIGKIEAAVAATYILQKIKTLKIINIGICSSNEKRNLNKLFRIKSVIEHSSGKKISLNPKTSLKTSKLITCDKEIEEDIGYPLIDMEAYGFIKASIKFMDMKNIFVYKIVSDILEPKIPPKNKIKELILKHIQKIEEDICKAQ